MLSEKREKFHGRNSSFEETEEVKGYLAYQNDEFLLVERLDDVRTAGNRTEALVKWRGFEEAESD